MERSDRYLAALTEEGRYRLLVEAVTDYAIYLLDPSGVVTTWNPGAQRFKGYTANEIIGQHFSLFYSEGDKKIGLPARALEIAKREGKFEAEGWRVRKDGSRFWAYVIIDPIRDPAGTIVGFAKITRDLTERKKAEEEIEKAREFSLQAQKLEAIGQLTGGIAHDFNNLLMAVLGSLELLRKRLPDDRKSVALLENAAQGAQRGTTLTKRMLAFARNYELTMEAIDVPELVHGMKELLERSIGPSFNIETRFPLSLKPAEADANQLELALLNLSLNARDAMPEGGDIVLAAREENIHAGHRSGLEAGRYIRLSVTDTGEGMDQETLCKSHEENPLAVTAVPNLLSEGTRRIGWRGLRTLIDGTSVDGNSVPNRCLTVKGLCCRLETISEETQPMFPRQRSYACPTHSVRVRLSSQDRARQSRSR